MITTANSHFRLDPRFEQGSRKDIPVCSSGAMRASRVAAGWMRSQAMEMSILMFLLGSAASYFPIYWALTRLLAYRKAKIQSNSVPSADDDARHQFLDCLRREAVTRVDAALNDAAAEVRLFMHDRNPASRLLDQDALGRLAETRRMVQSLFSADATAAFDKVIADLNQLKPWQSNELSVIILDFKTKLVEERRPKKAGKIRGTRWLDAISQSFAGLAAYRSTEISRSV